MISCSLHISITRITIDRCPIHGKNEVTILYQEALKLLIFLLDFFFFFFVKIMSGQTLGVARGLPLVNLFFFFFFFFLSYMLPLFFRALLSYLVGMKKRTSRRVACRGNNSRGLCYVLISPEAEILCRP